MARPEALAYRDDIACFVRVQLVAGLDSHTTSQKQFHKTLVLSVTQLEGPCPVASFRKLVRPSQIRRPADDKLLAFVEIHIPRNVLLLFMNPYYEDGQQVDE